MFTGVTFFTVIFLGFHIVKSLVPILALLPNSITLKGSQDFNFLCSSFSLGYGCRAQSILSTFRVFRK